MLFESFRKRRAIKSFIRRIGPTLEKRHGRKAHYTPDEVRTAANDTGTMNQWVPYACVIYCTQQAFAQDATLGSTSEYDAMRGEVAQSQFGGDTTFDATTAIEAADPPATDSGGGSDYGGDFGGGDGGGDGGGGGD